MSEGHRRESAGDRPWWKEPWRWLAGAGAAIGILTAGFFGNPDFNENVCRDLFPSALNETFLCGQEHRKIDVAEARELLASFYGKASTNGQAEAWRLYGEELRETRPLEPFLEEWESAIWAEVLSIAPVSGFNRFDAQVRVYRGEEPARLVDRWPGDVLVVSEALAIRRGETGIEIVDRDFLERIDEADLDYPAVTLIAETVTRRLPRASSEREALADQTTPGGHLYGLCQVERTTPGERAGAADLGWWTRTELGWVPNGNLETEGSPVAGLGACGPSALER